MDGSISDWHDLTTNSTRAYGMETSIDKSWVFHQRLSMISMGPVLPVDELGSRPSAVTDEWRDPKYCLLGFFKKMSHLLHAL